MMKSAIVLTALFVSTGATAQTVTGMTEVAHVRRAAPRNDVESKARLLGVLLYSDISVQFADLPARDAIQYLGNSLGINIVGRFNDDRTGDGIDPDAPITLDLANQPALAVLEAVLDRCEDSSPVTWQIRPGYVEVGTKSRLLAPAAREIRAYPIHDLIVEVPQFDNAPAVDIAAALNQANAGGGGFGGGGSGGFGGGSGGSGGWGGGNGGGIIGQPDEDPYRKSDEERAQELIDLIKEVIEPEHWADTGGGLNISYYQGSLIVRAPDFVHRQLGGYPTAIRPHAPEPPVR